MLNYTIKAVNSWKTSFGETGTICTEKMAQDWRQIAIARAFGEILRSGQEKRQSGGVRRAGVLFAKRRLGEILRSGQEKRQPGGVRRAGVLFAKRRLGEILRGGKGKQWPGGVRRAGVLFAKRRLGEILRSGKGKQWPGGGRRPTGLLRRAGGSSQGSPCLLRWPGPGVQRGSGLSTRKSGAPVRAWFGGPGGRKPKGMDSARKGPGASPCRECVRALCPCVFSFAGPSAR